MAEERREKPQWWLERQRAGLREEAGDEPETSATRRRQQARLFLRPYERDEKEANERKNRKRPQFED
jgi:hypothetical protein